MGQQGQPGSAQVVGTVAACCVGPAVEDLVEAGHLKPAPILENWMDLAVRLRPVRLHYFDVAVALPAGERLRVERETFVWSEGSRLAAAFCLGPTYRPSPFSR